jgi:hypothetical protein
MTRCTHDNAKREALDKAGTIDFKSGFLYITVVMTMIYITYYFLKKNNININNQNIRWGSGTPWGIWLFTVLSAAVITLIRMWQERSLHENDEVKSANCTSECGDVEGGVCLWNLFDTMIYLVTTLTSFTCILVWMTNKYTSPGLVGGGEITDKVLGYLNPQSQSMEGGSPIIWVGGISILINSLSAIYIYLSNVKLNQTNWLSLTGYTSSLSTLLMICIAFLFSLVFGINGGHDPKSFGPRIFIFLMVLGVSIWKINKNHTKEDSGQNAFLGGSWRE